MPPCASMRFSMKRRRLASRARGGDPVARVSDYPAWSSACAMRQPLGSLCGCAGTMAACDACKSVAGLPCGTAVASRCCRSGGFWYVPVTLSTRHGPSSRRVPVTGQVISVACFIKRWSIETTFEENRAHLGFETQRQWSDLAIERTPPCLLSLYSLVALLASWPVSGRSLGGATECLACQGAGDV